MKISLGAYLAQLDAKSVDFYFFLTRVNHNLIIQIKIDESLYPSVVECKNKY